MNRKPTRPRRGQRGIALITAIILVALATILAVAVGSRSALYARRSAASFSVEQGLQFAAGAEALAAYVLREDRNPQDTAGETWAQPYGPVEVAPGISLEAVIQDEQGKFNINTLLDSHGEIDKDSVAIFARLLELLQIEPRWAPLLGDWLDGNVLAEPAGGEDALYLGQSPPYRAANQPVTSISELLQLPGFGRERYLKLAPHITALPPDAARINVCLASGPVLDALAALSESSRNAVEYSRMDPRQIIDSRSRGCFPTVAVLRTTVRPDIDKRITEKSSYFRLQSWVSIGTTRFALYSLLHRDGSGQVRPVLRTLGTE
jgi:general secretion pathway protein K